MIIHVKGNSSWVFSIENGDAKEGLLCMAELANPRGKVLNDRVTSSSADLSKSPAYERLSPSFDVYTHTWHELMHFRVMSYGMVNFVLFMT